MSDERDRLLDAIREVHSQHADDLCWMPADVNKIFAAAGLPPQDLRVGDKAAMLKNCERYVECLQSGGPWRTYAELEAELDKLVAFYRGEGYADFGQQGDNDGLSPADTAIRAMRECIKLRREVDCRP